MKKHNQIKIAEKAGITQGYLSKVMSGMANPTIHTLNKIAAAYGISLQKLIKKIESNRVEA